MQRDRKAVQQLDFIFKFAELAEFENWVTIDLIRAGAWFAAPWPQPQGGIGVRRFVEEPSYPTYYPGVGWHVSAQVEVRGRGLAPTDCLTVRFSSIDDFELVSGDVDLFSIVSTPYGPGMHIADQNAGTEARIKQAISRANLESLSVKFIVEASYSDDAARLEIQGSGSTTALTFIPRREGFYDPTRRPLIAGASGGSVFPSATAVDILAWYQFDLVTEGGLHCVLTRLSDGSAEVTPLPSVVLGDDLVSFSFSADSGGLTCPVTYAALHIC